jgi:hypothetical protein
MMSDGIRYHIGLAFTAPIALEDTPPAAEATAGNDAVQAALVDPLEPDDAENRW